MTTCDVLIVGGGPAGSSCAWKLQQEGFDVLVLDKKPSPRDKPCAGWITPAVVEALRLDLREYGQGRVLEAITGFGTGLIRGPEILIDYGRPISYGIRRREFDHYLLQRSGARLELGESLKSLKRLDGNWIVNERIKTPMIVGAGGHFCPVARHLGAKPGGGELAVAAQEIEFELNEQQLRDCPVRRGVPYLYFCEDFEGYGWYYRKGNYLNVGLGREDSRQLGSQVDAFTAFLKQQKKIPQDSPGRYVGHAYLIYTHSPRKVLDDGMLLIGDAAGLAYPYSGEGIRPAVESGMLAAQIIQAASGDYRSVRLEPYQDALIACYGRRSLHSSYELLPASWKRYLAAKLMASRWFARHVIVDRWFLHRQEKSSAIA